jgi:ketosteroid isomerase-like protein
MSQENVEVVRGVLTAIVEKRLGDAIPHLHPELEIIPSADFPESEVLRGLTGFGHWATRWPEMLEDYEVTPVRFWDVRDEVVATLHERGRLGRSGIAVEDRFAHVWTLREGAVVRIQVFDDQAEALEAVGLPE